MQLLRGVGLEHGSIGTYLVFELAQDGTGDIAAFYSLLVHIIIQCGWCSTEHRADVDINDGTIGVVRGEVHTETAAEVVSGTHDGAEVGVALFAGIGHLGKLLGKHPEGEHIAEVALVVVGTLNQNGFGDGGGNDTDGGLRLVFQLLVLSAIVTTFAELLFRPTLFLVVRFESMVHQEVFDVSGKLFTAGLWSLDDNL